MAYVHPPDRARPAPTAQLDSELLERIAQRDEAALGELYMRYRPLVANIVWRIVRDDSTTDEVVQDVFQSVWNGAACLPPSTNMAHWLGSIARFRAIDAWRSRLYRERQREEWLDDPAVREQLGPVEGIEETLVLRESVRATLALLSPAYRATIALAYGTQLSPPEIAAHIGVPLSTVRRRLRYGLQKLRIMLGSEPAPALADTPPMGSLTWLAAASLDLRLDWDLALPVTEIAVAAGA